MGTVEGYGGYGVRWVQWRGAVGRWSGAVGTVEAYGGYDGGV